MSAKAEPHLRKMRVSEIKAKAYEAAELLQGAKPGRGTVDQRADRRAAACRVLASLPTNWWRRLSEKDRDAIGAALLDAD